MNVEFWIDPICPWCWITSRWIGEVAPHRDLDIVWRPISLLFKNEVAEDSPMYEPLLSSHQLLRVIESVRSELGDTPIGGLYTAMGESIHHEQNMIEPSEALERAGLPQHHASAATDSVWDEAIRASMADGLGLTGEDVGTPIIGVTNPDGSRDGFFGPVISRRLPLDQALQLWDGFIMVLGVDGFWELKRTRTESPNFDLPD